MSRDIAQQLADQHHRCAYPCEGDGRGGEIEPGEPVALAYDGAGIIHLRCAQIGQAPGGGRRCQHCGKSIEHLRVDAAYCDSTCRTEASRQRRGVSARKGAPSFPWPQLRERGPVAARRGRTRYASRRVAA